MRNAFAAAMLAAAVAGAAPGDSLYRSVGGFSNLFTDRKAFAVGDIIHILVTESASASQNMQDTNASSSEAQVGPGLGKLSFLPLWGYSGDISAASKGTTSRSDSLTARLAVTVVGVAPNGNLLVEGERLVGVHKNHQTLKISGEVRPRDVGADSSVSSYKVANIKLSYSGSSPNRPGSQTGIITRLLHWLF
jgi:flagellar L-ring protein precursor FlgH